MPQTNLIPLVRKNILTYAHAAVGVTMFRHIFVYDPSTNQEVDTMGGGARSCASFVSTVLAMVSLIDRPHSTVAATILKMEEAGWVKQDSPKVGGIIHWPAGEEGHAHLGFVVGENQAISNSGETRTPQLHGLGHPVTGIQPDAFYWHPSLDNSATNK